MNNYQPVVTLTEVPYCKILSGVKDLPVYDSIIDIIRKLGGDFMELCSRKGEFKAMNVSGLNLQVAKTFPSGDYRTNGDYRVNLQIFDSKDENIFNITVHSTIVQ
jgi:hypothetical protein